MHRDYLYWIWISLVFGPGVTGFREVLEQFGDPYAAYIASEQELALKLGKRSPVIERLRNKDLREAHRIYDFCVTHGVSLLTYGDIAYPALLKTIQNPPVLLYYVGTLPALNRKLCIGMVGTRKMSEYGKRMAYKIGYELAAADVVVVSGMALGCDAVAAAGALGANGATVAVLGSGIDVIYPRQHAKLMEAIRHSGAVMTEYPPGTPPAAGHFPVRNRIISGLSHGTLAVEGDLRSGALLTVGHAIKQGRRVFAVPGNVGESNSQGTNELIRNGATVTLDAGDILNAFEVTWKDRINSDGYVQAQMHSEPDEELLLRLGITSRLREKEAEEVQGDAVVPDVLGKRRSPKDALLPRQKSKKEDAPKPQRTRKEDGDTERKAEPKQAQQEQQEQRKQIPTGDNSESALASLSEKERLVFSEMPLDRAVSIDRLSALGLPIGDLITALTLLELHGLISALPGGLYIKK